MHTHTERDVCTERQAHTHTHTHWGNVKRKTMTDWRHVAAAAAAAAATTASHYERIHRNRQRCREATTTREEQKKRVEKACMRRRDTLYNILGALTAVYQLLSIIYVDIDSVSSRYSFNTIDTTHLYSHWICST